jgi:hypothetical protein
VMVSHHRQARQPAFSDGGLEQGFHEVLVSISLQASYTASVCIQYQANSAIRFTLYALRFTNSAHALA